MTKAEAYSVLGTSNSVACSKTELLYQQKRKELRLQMVPGMPVATRQKAMTDLTTLEAAWQVLQTAPPTPHRSPKRARSKPMPAQPVTAANVASPWAQSLGEAWDQVILLLPFSRPVSSAVLLLLLVVTLTFVIVALMR
jgi:hypothetical protein